MNPVASGVPGNGGKYPVAVIHLSSLWIRSTFDTLCMTHSSRGKAVVSGGHINSSEGRRTGFVRTAASSLSALKSINHKRRLRWDSMGAEN